MTRRFILTGAPGGGKSSIAAALRARGHVVVGEAATDVIGALQAGGEAEPWTGAGFIDRIAAVQRARQRAATGAVQVFDRAPACTLALAVYSGQTPSAALLAAAAEPVYERRVFFVRLMGFITPTAARRISLADSERFERIHEEVYLSLGYELVEVPPGSVAARTALVEEVIAGSGSPAR